MGQRWASGVGRAVNRFSLFARGPRDVRSSMSRSDPSCRLLQVDVIASMSSGGRDCGRTRGRGRDSDKRVSVSGPNGPAYRGCVVPLGLALLRELLCEGRTFAQQRALPVNNIHSGNKHKSDAEQDGGGMLQMVVVLLSLLAWANVCVEWRGGHG